MLILYNSYTLAKNGDESGDCGHQKQLSPTCIAYDRHATFYTKIVPNMGLNTCKDKCYLDVRCFAFQFHDKCVLTLVKSTKHGFSRWGPLNNKACGKHLTQLALMKRYGKLYSSNKVLK